MYAVRGWHAVPDANIEAGQPNVPEHAVRLQKYMGGSCLHKWDKAGRPIYIERMVIITFLFQSTDEVLRIYWGVVHDRERMKKIRRNKEITTCRVIGLDSLFPFCITPGTNIAGVTQLSEMS